MKDNVLNYSPSVVKSKGNILFFVNKHYSVYAYVRIWSTTKRERK